MRAALRADAVRRGRLSGRRLHPQRVFRPHRPDIVRRSLRAAMAATTVVLLFGVRPPAASACSCAGYDNPRAALAAVEGAFVGTIERIDSDEDDPYGSDSAFHFAVEHAVKGGFGERAVVHAQRGDGGSCGLEGEVGTRLGLFLRREDGRWTAGLCTTVAPDRLLEAARPLPAPDGRGPPRFVVGNSLGEHSTMLLDADGRTLAYGEAPGRQPADVAALDVCPGGARVVEAVLAHGGDEDRPVLVVRSVDGLRIERVVRVGDLPGVGGSFVYVHAVACRDAAATQLDVALVHHVDETTRGRVLRAAGGTWRIVWEGGEVELRLSDDPGRAALSRPGVLERLDLATGTVTALHRHANLGAAAVSPGGLWAAVVASGASTYRPEELVVVDMRTGGVRARHAFDPSEELVELVWADDDTLAAADGHTLTFFDPQLREVGTVGGWQTYRLLAAGGRVYGVRYGQQPMLVATRSNRTPSEFVRLPDGGTRALAVLPADVPSEPGPSTTAPPTTSPPSTAPPVSLPEALTASERASERPWGAAGVGLVLVGVLAVALRSRAGSRAESQAGSQAG